ncbi:hypothetical protein GCM10023235_12500 [Kitasatospora terrestris]|uniref:Uncharacterized protein n=1 Tax=Kitasatospora terrestris TaxID=258051 RepID=A0ABP9DFW1_9ACTN
MAQNRRKLGGELHDEALEFVGSSQRLGDPQLDEWTAADGPCRQPRFIEKVVPTHALVSQLVMFKPLLVNPGTGRAPG